MYATLYDYFADVVLNRGGTKPVLDGDELKANPTQREASEALKKLWQKLGGTIVVLLVAVSAFGLSPDTEWRDVPPETRIGDVFQQSSDSTNAAEFVVGEYDRTNLTDRIGAKASAQDLTSHTGNSDIHVTADDKTRWEAKQDAISTLPAIKEGAAKGMTAIQSLEPSTNYTDTVAQELENRIPQDYASVSNAALYASNAVDRIRIDHTDETFSNEVVSVVVSDLRPEITEEVYIAATNACATLGIDPALIPQGGTIGTVGGLLLTLAAAVALLNRKTKLLKSNGTAEDEFATDILGKQVANVKANTASLAAAYSETATYAVGDAVTHDGKLYKCAVAITTAEAWTPAHWTETTVATLWNNADTTSYGGQN